MNAKIFARSARGASLVDDSPSSVSMHTSVRGRSLAMLVVGAFALAGAGCGAGDLQAEDLQGEDLQAGEEDELAEAQAALAAWPPNASLQIDTNFESGNYSPWSAGIVGGGTISVFTDDGTVAKAPNSGLRAVKMSVAGSDTYGAQLSNSSPPPNGARMDYDSEYYIGFAFRVEKWEPTDWAMIFQLRGVPSDLSSCKSGRNPVSITMSSDTKLGLNVINTPKLTPATGGGGGVQVWSAASPVVLNAWHRWVIHIRPSAMSGGIIQVWLNGTEIYKRIGANVDALDTCGAAQANWIYPMFGIYKSYSNTNPQTVVYDDIRIVKGSGFPSLYNLVRPPGLPAK